ncbi:NAD(P)HX epimerase [Alkalibacterium sp. AK22]|uniref:NAD(P)H-hydrate epimerase n=1 Tax=Alkalibacterium sp. AK22 TaxID=1229520 RepID=UPI00044C6245|nr:NAD(P)H-hydrate epimerase [Alkalibacterium sp. AK22]EXJ22634.1 NAD(P)HX epimerase [Alkalibacterium sp. AK22]
MRSLSASEIKAIDRYTIEEIGIPSMVLMERAALAITAKLSEYYPKKAFLIYCGTGNNGGDGLAVARLLYQAGRHVAVNLVGDFSFATEEEQTQLTIIRNLKVPEKEDGLASTEAGDWIIVDAIFGIGLNRAVAGSYLEAIQCINASGAEIVALDIPSGLEADTGQVFSEAVKANRTFTIGFYKKGFEHAKAVEWTGDVEELDIGYPRESLLLEALNKE